MSRKIIGTLCLLLLQALPVPLWAQLPPSSLFSDTSLLHISLQGDLRSLFTDRGKDPAWHTLQLQIQDSGQIAPPISIKARTRGHFRRTATFCSYPPLMLDLPAGKIAGHAKWQGINRVKLVLPCVQEQYVVQEYLAYRLYQLLTPYSFGARLVRITLLQNGQPANTSVVVTGILLEPENMLAKRNGLQVLKTTGLTQQQLQAQAFHTMAIFQYLLGNTDWSVTYRHNILLLGIPGGRQPVPVPFDFDQCGMVNTPYAIPAEALELQSVKERRYRGYCLPDVMATLQPVLNLVQQQRPAMMALYTQPSLLNPSAQQWSLRYLDDFFATIGQRERASAAFGFPCRYPALANVHITGMVTEK